MLLCFLVKDLVLLFSTGNELGSFQIKEVNKKQPKDKAYIYFTFKCAS